MTRIKITPVKTQLVTVISFPGMSSGVITPEYLNDSGASLPAFSLLRVTPEGSLALVDTSSAPTSGAMGFLTASVSPGEYGRLQLAGATEFLLDSESAAPASGSFLFASNLEPGKVSTASPSEEGHTVIQLGRVANGKLLINMRLEVAIL
jgi:hypothetical protein